MEAAAERAERAHRLDGRAAFEGRGRHFINLAGLELGAEYIAARVGDEIDVPAALDQLVGERLRRKKMAARTAGGQHNGTTAHSWLPLPEVIVKPLKPCMDCEASLDAGRRVRPAIIPSVIAEAINDERP